jgi:hypothetical protein
MYVVCYETKKISLKALALLAKRKRLLYWQKESVCFTGKKIKVL